MNQHLLKTGYRLFLHLAIFAALAGSLSAQSLDAPPPAPAQDQGLVYTHSGHDRALATIQPYIALYATPSFGCRYAYVQGKKIRLDPLDVLGGDPVVQADGGVLVPAAFADALALKTFAFDTPPDYLKDKWVYSLALPAQPADRSTVPLEKAASAAGWQIHRYPRGLILLSRSPITFAPDATLLDNIVTLFDTPEKLADPDLATRSIPTLTRQGKWTDHVKVTPEQLAILDGPETKWPLTPRSAYDLAGFNAALLGSTPPAPGVYPRLLFSPQDVPLLLARLRTQKTGQMSLIELEELLKKSWWDPKTSDGEVFAKLVAGRMDELKFPEVDLKARQFSPPNPYTLADLFAGQKPGIFNTHVAYVPECLTAMALYCLLTEDGIRGRQVAQALVNYYGLRERLADGVNAQSESQHGAAPFDGSSATTHFRGMAATVAHMNLPFALDFAGKWMTADEKAFFYRLIAKVTYGRRSFAQDGPERFRDINWMTWDLTHFLSVAAIEGQPGFDPEGYEAARRSVRAFLEWGIDPAGQIYESNGKNGAGLHFFFLSMNVLARRGDNFWGHPHLRNFLTAQVQTTSPNGGNTLSGGSFSGSSLAPVNLDVLKAFYPGDRAADYLLTQLDRAGSTSTDNAAKLAAQHWKISGFEPVAYRVAIAKSKLADRVRLPSSTYPAFTRSVLYDTDWTPTTRADLGLPLDFVDPVHGVFSSYSDRTPEAAWLAFLVRPNHYLGAGHHHSDAGLFLFSALGVNWITESPFMKHYDGKYHNQVLVDGESQPGQFPARAAWLGATTGESAATAAADLTYAYSWRWNTQPPPVWKVEKNLFTDTGSKLPAWDPKSSDLAWELEPAPDILKLFAGTARYKMRPWWSTYTFSNYIATSRAPFNPVEYALRSVALVRGPRPYGLVVDDVKKDAQTRLYEWTAMPGPGVTGVKLPGACADELTLVRAADLQADGRPKPGAPLLLIRALDATGEVRASFDTALVAPKDRDFPDGGTYRRVTFTLRAAQANFKVLLVSYHAGESAPAIAYDAVNNTATLTPSAGGPVDTLSFAAVPGGPTRGQVRRAGRTLLAFPPASVSTATIPDSSATITSSPTAPSFDFVAYGLR